MSIPETGSTLRLAQCVRACLCCATVAREEVSAEVHSNMAGVPATWETVVAGRSIFWERGYREILEASLPSEVTPFYLLLHVDGVPAVAYAAQSLVVSDELLALRDRTDYQARQRPALRDTVGRWLRNRALGLLGRRVLVLGDLYSCGPHGACAAPGVSEDLPWQLLPKALEALYKVAGAHDFILVKDLDEHSRGLVSGLKRGGFAQIPLEPSMQLDCAPEWLNHGDYLAALNAKYRKATLKVHDAIAAEGITLEAVDDIGPWAPQMHALYLQVEARALNRFGTLSPEYLTQLATGLGPERFRCTMLRRGGALLGFSTILKDGEIAIAHIVGFDYTANQRAPIYLQLLHGLIDDGLTFGCTSIQFGRTALEPKARLGAKPKPTEIWLRHRNPLLNLVVAPLMSLVPQDTAPERDPFRQRLH